MSHPRYVRARSVAEAIAALSGEPGEGLVVAGGIVVSSLLNQRLVAPNVLVDIARIGELSDIERRADGSVFIGALATHEDILRSAEIARSAPLLAEIATDIACPRLRNRGTIGGSLCTIGGQGDPATGLIALQAKLHLRGPSGARSLPVEHFYKDQFEIDIAPDEILERIEVPPLEPGACFGFCKIGPRSAMDWTQITAAIAFVLRAGAVSEPQIGMNGVADTPNRPRNVEQVLDGRKPDRVDWRAVAAALDAEIAPTGDLVYSAEYKRHLGKVTLNRAFHRALKRGTVLEAKRCP
jgi:aerobic carbon-monoxide dehydrogenase medium subunit